RERRSGQHRGDDVTDTAVERSDVAWYTLSAADAAARLTVDPEQGLDDAEASKRLAQDGPNQRPTEPPPSGREGAPGHLSNPMNIMLLIVSVLSFVIGQIPTGLFVLGLVTFNVVMGSSQELKARASVEALAQLQVPVARVRRGGRLVEVESTNVVPGDVV